jgi:hypothetical protein
MSGEHDFEPIAEPAPAVAAPAPDVAPGIGAAFGGGMGAGFAPTSLTPGQAVALSRTAGNQAVTQLIARQPAAAPAAPPPAGTAPGASASTAKGLKHADFSPTGGDPSASGTVSVTPNGADAVTLNAPEVTAGGGVTWNAPATPPDPAAPPPDPAEARAGWINTLLSGDRKLTYTEDGTPGGKVVREQHMMSTPGGRDAMWAEDKRTGTQVQHSGSEAPFYGSAKRVRRGETVQLDQFKDQPGGGAQREMEGTGGAKGKLAKVSGADKFRLSVGIAEVGNAETIHLTAKEWTVPWDVTVDQKGGGQGAAISVDAFRGQLQDIERGKGFVVGDAGDFPWPQTPDDVKRFTSTELMNAIPYAQSLDAASWTLMCQELRARNPSCTVTTLVKESTALVSDDVAITIKGPRTATRNASEGLSAAKVTFRLLDLMDPQDIKSGLVLELTVSIEGSSPQPMTWPYPFGPLRSTRYWWDSKGATQGEWSDPKGLKRDVQTDIVIATSGFA